MGRPSDYSQEIATAICAELAEGRSLRAVCKNEGMPAVRTVYYWLNAHQEFLQQYTRAREDGADSWADEIVDIADGEPGGDVQRDRLRVDARKWSASKLKPKKYGDKLTHEGDPDKPLRHVHRVELVDLDSGSDRTTT